MLAVSEGVLTGAVGGAAGAAGMLAVSEGVLTGAVDAAAGAAGVLAVSVDVLTGAVDAAVMVESFTFMVILAVAASGPRRDVRRGAAG